MRTLLQQALSTAFHVKVIRQTRDTDALILKAPGGKPAGLTKTASTGGSMYSTGRGQVRLVGSPLSALAKVMSGVLRRPVIDETGLAGKYDIVLQFDANEPESLVQALRDKLGLTAEPARRAVEFLIVSPGNAM